MSIEQRQKRKHERGEKCDGVLWFVCVSVSDRWFAWFFADLMEEGNQRQCRRSSLCVKLTNVSMQFFCCCWKEKKQIILCLIFSGASQFLWCNFFMQRCLFANFINHLTWELVLNSILTLWAGVQSCYILACTWTVFGASFIWLVSRKIFKLSRTAWSFDRNSSPACWSDIVILIFHSLFFYAGKYEW